MIDVRYSGYELSVSGHAGQAPAGHDIVCAGVSALLCSLAEMLERHRDDMTELTVSVASGNGHIKAIPKAAFEHECRGAFETAICGYEGIAENYPGYIRLLPM